MYISFLMHSYEETFDFMLTPMLDIFEQHFQLFCERSALSFVYNAFSCEASCQMISTGIRVLTHFFLDV